MLLSHVLTRCLSLSHTHTLTHTLTLSHSHTLTLSHSHTLTLSRQMPPSHVLTRGEVQLLRDHF